MQWLILGTPDGPRLWPVGDTMPADIEALINAARVITGFPATDSWIQEGPPWDVQIASGDPHPDLMAQATVGTVEELRAVTADRVAAYAAGRAQWAKASAVDAVAAAMGALDAESQRAVLSKCGISTTNPATAPAKGAIRA